VRVSLVVASAVILLAAAPVTSSAATPVLNRLHPPDHAYSLLLPAGWRYRDVSYPSDHATQLWWTPRDPLARAIVVLSGCVGCVSTNGAPNPAGAVADAVQRHRISPNVLAFEGGYDQAEAGYDDNGLVIVTHQNGHVTGFVRIDLWLPYSQHALAAKILNSFRLA
jgi:hypothetical protein